MEILFAACRIEHRRAYMVNVFGYNHFLDASRLHNSESGKKKYQTEVSDSNVRMKNASNFVDHVSCNLRNTKVQAGEFLLHDTNRQQER